MPTQQRNNLNTNLATVLQPIVDIPQHLETYQLMMDYVDVEIAAVKTSGDLWSHEKSNYYTKSQVDVLISAALAAAGGTDHITSFVVGDSGEMVAGATGYTNTIISGATASELMVFVEGFKVMANRTDRFSFTKSGSTIAFTHGLNSGSTVEIYYNKPSGSVGSSIPSGNYLMWG